MMMQAMPQASSAGQHSLDLVGQGLQPIYQIEHHRIGLGRNMLFRCLEILPAQ